MKRFLYCSGYDGLESVFRQFKGKEEDELTEETPIRPVIYRHLFRRANYYTPFRISFELSVETSDRLNEPVIILKVAVRSCSLHAGEMASEEQEILRRVVDFELRRGTFG